MNIKTLIFIIIIFFSCKQKNNSWIEEEIKSSNKLELLNRNIYASNGIEKNLEENLRNTNIRQYSIIQFSEKLNADNFKSLKKLDIRLLGYLKNNFYYTSVPPKINLNEVNIIKWAGSFRIDDVISKRLLNGEYDKMYVDSISGKINILIQYFEDVNKDEIYSGLKKIGITAKRYGYKNSWQLQVEKVKLKELLNLKGIKSVQEGPLPFLPLNNTGRSCVNTDQAQGPIVGHPQPIYRLSGKNIKIGICDGGISKNSNDFRTIKFNGNLGVSRVYYPSPLIELQPPLSSVWPTMHKLCSSLKMHGTRVASIAGGNGYNSTRFELRGQAPESQLGDYKLFSGNAQLYYDAIVLDDTDITNHSYTESPLSYTIMSENIDDIIQGSGVDDDNRPIPRRPQVWGAGNRGLKLQNDRTVERGYYSVTTQSKNSISVGSVDSENYRLSNYSSLGPTYDGRIKPDIVAPGCFNSRTKPNDEGMQASDCVRQAYNRGRNCGTSFAAPVVSGIIALMMESYNKSFNKEPNQLNPSTYKAILINTATDLVKKENFPQDSNNPDTGAPVRFYEGPDYCTGYGLVNAKKAVETINNNRLWIEGTFSTKSLMYSFSVPDGSKDIQITLAWDDLAGSHDSAPKVSKLVNDLDLKIIDPDGNTCDECLPWKLDPLALRENLMSDLKDPIDTSQIKPAYRGVDRLNNVEMVTIHNPQTGSWKIKIEGFEIPLGLKQKFSIASSHEFTKLLELPICLIYPSICEFSFPPSFFPLKNTWEIHPQNPTISFDDICRYDLNFPRCDNIWSSCPRYDFRVTGIPPNSIISVVNDSGEIITSDRTNEKIRKIKTGEIESAQKLYLVITSKNDNLLKDIMNIKIETEK